MGRYTLEVVAPLVKHSPSDEGEQLVSALDAVATTHGGMVVDASTRASKKKRQRQYVNIFDCEDSLGREVEWLRKKFPDTRFTVKEFTAP
jgi:hypothetical protein